MVIYRIDVTRHAACYTTCGRCDTPRPRREGERWVDISGRSAL